MPKVSFVIPLFNCLELTKACLASLSATIPRGLDHEILLIDDGSTDGTREWLRTLSAPVRVVLHDGNRGYAAANNRGAREASGDFLVLLNNDLVLLPGWLQPMLSALGDDPSVGVAGNIQRRVDSDAIDHSGLLVTPRGKIAHDRSTLAPGQLIEVPAVTAACALARRHQFLAAGGFDEAFVNGGEDVDFCLRLASMGYRTVVATGSIVKHHVSATRGPTGERDERNSRLLVHRWREELIRWGAVTWAREQLAAHPPSLWSREGRRSRALRSFLRTHRNPPGFARRRLESALHREEVRWKFLFDLPPGTPRAPVAPGRYRALQFGRDNSECVWIRNSARIELPAGMPVSNLFLAGFLVPADPAYHGPDRPIGFRITINGEQTVSIPAVSPGNFNFAVDDPFTLPDRPTVLDIELVGVRWTNKFARAARILEFVPMPEAWKTRLKRLRQYRHNRRLRFAVLVCDDEVIFDFRREPALAERLR